MASPATHATRLTKSYRLARSQVDRVTSPGSLLDQQIELKKKSPIDCPAKTR